MRPALQPPPAAAADPIEALEQTAKEAALALARHVTRALLLLPPSSPALIVASPLICSSLLQANERPHPAGQAPCRGEWFVTLSGEKRDGSGSYLHEDGRATTSEYAAGAPVGVGVGWSVDRHTAWRLVDGEAQVTGRRCVVCDTGCSHHLFTPSVHTLCSHRLFTGRDRSGGGGRDCS